MEGFIFDGRRRVIGIKIWDRAGNKHSELRADLVINATGAWVGEIAAKAEGRVPVQPTPGVMVAFDKRLVQRPINRLNRPADGDIILPQRRMVVVGTTSYQVVDLDYVPVEKDQVKLMVERGAELLPELLNLEMRGVFTATRPLIGKNDSGRSISRTFECFDHEQTDGIPGLVIDYRVEKRPPCGRWPKKLWMWCVPGWEFKLFALPKIRH